MYAAGYEVVPSVRLRGGSLLGQVHTQQGVQARTQQGVQIIPRPVSIIKAHNSEDQEKNKEELRNLDHMEVSLQKPKTLWQHVQYTVACHLFFEGYGTPNDAHASLDES